MKHLKLLPVALLLAACTTQPTSPSGQEINDANTPLHLLQPDYDHPYGVPAEADVKATMDRVLSYISEAMPAVADDSLRLVQGKFRLTTYECGVTYAAALSAYSVTNDTAYLRFTADRLDLIASLAPQVEERILANPQFDPQMRRVVKPAALDDAGAMAAAMMRLSLQSPSQPTQGGGDQMSATTASAQSSHLDGDRGGLIARYVDYIMNKEYRLKDGTFARNRPHHNTVWLDDMYMAIPALAWYSTYSGDARYMDEAIRQLHLFKDKMWVADRQLFRHGWVEGMEPHPNFHWGRCNGWAILTMCEVLDQLPASRGEDRAFVIDLLRQHIEGLCRLQHHSGLWHQLLDREDTYLESSCTAIYAYCIAHAINEGWVDPLAYGAQVFLAWGALSDCVNAQGQVEQTCVGTGMGFDPAFYAYRPVHVMAAHGYGPVIWAGAEVIRMLHSTWPKLNDSAIHLYRTEQHTSEPIFSEDVAGGELF